MAGLIDRAGDSATGPRLGVLHRARHAHREAPAEKRERALHEQLADAVRNGIERASRTHPILRERDAVINVNGHHPYHEVFADPQVRRLQMAQEVLDRPWAGAKIAVLGAAFKPESDDIRDSPALNVAGRLHLFGAHVTVHDPQAMANARKHSGAANLWLRCTVRSPYAEIEVGDDGQLTTRMLPGTYGYDDVAHLRTVPFLIVVLCLLNDFAGYKTLA